MSFFEEVYEIVSKVPEGKVITYGLIAKTIGNPHISRQVGWALHANPKPGMIPCHRVVNRHGELSKGFAFGGIDIQKKMLEDEGVEVSGNYTVDLKKYLL